MKIVAFCLGCWLAYGFFSHREEFNGDSARLLFDHVKNRVSTLRTGLSSGPKMLLEPAFETSEKPLPQTEFYDEIAMVKSPQRKIIAPEGALLAPAQPEPSQTEQELPEAAVYEFAEQPEQLQEPVNIEDLVNAAQAPAPPNFHPLWSSFTTHSSAKGFASQVQLSSGVALHVHTIGIGEYQVMLPYSTTTKLNQDLARIKQRLAIAVE